MIRTLNVKLTKGLQYPIRVQFGPWGIIKVDQLYCILLGHDVWSTKWSHEDGYRDSDFQRHRVENLIRKAVKHLKDNYMLPLLYCSCWYDGFEIVDLSEPSAETSLLSLESKASVHEQHWLTPRRGERIARHLDAASTGH